MTLEYAIVGTGEPAVCIQGAFVAGGFQSLVEESSLVSRYRLITYHRRGYLGSGRISTPYASVCRPSAAGRWKPWRPTTRPRTIWPPPARQRRS